MRPPEPIIVADLFPGERAALLDLLAKLADAEWERPTACAGWSVKDVALHLLGGDLANLSRRRDRFNSAVATGETGDLSEWANLVAFINRWNEQWVAAARRLSPRVLRDLLAFAGDELHAYYASLDPYALGGAVSWAGPEPAPVWLDLAREYTEHWTHQQQIRDAVDRPGLKERRWFAPVLDAFVRALPYTLRQIERPAGVCLKLVITGEAGGEWTAVRTASRWELVVACASPPAAAVALDQETAWRLFTKGLTPQAALTAGHLGGDLPLARAALDMVSMIA